MRKTPSERALSEHIWALLTSMFRGKYIDYPSFEWHLGSVLRRDGVSRTHGPSAQ